MVLSVSNLTSSSASGKATGRVGQGRISVMGNRQDDWYERALVYSTCTFLVSESTTYLARLVLVIAIEKGRTGVAVDDSLPASTLERNSGR